MINCQREKQNNISIIYHRADTQNRDTWKKIVQSQRFLKTTDSQGFWQTARDMEDTLINTVMDYGKQLDMCKISVIHVQDLTDNPLDSVHSPQFFP